MIDENHCILCVIFEGEIVPLSVWILFHTQLNLWESFHHLLNQGVSISQGLVDVDSLTDGFNAFFVISVSGQHWKHSWIFIKWNFINVYRNSISNSFCIVLKNIFFYLKCLILFFHKPCKHYLGIAIWNLLCNQMMNLFWNKITRVPH